MNIILFLSFLFLSINTNAELQILSDQTSLTGNFIQGGIIIGKTLPENQIIFENLTLQVSPAGDFIFGLNRDEAKQIKLVVVLKDGTIVNHSLNIKHRKYDIQRIDGLPKAKVSPKKPEVLKRIKLDSAQVANARLRDDARLNFKETFIWPTTGRISGVYGSQRILNGEPKWPHYGVDVAAPVGDNVIAPASGIITLAVSDMFYSGGTIILDHGHGLSSSFLHLSEILVKEGDMVKQGDLIAKVGATGRVTGAHLDWRMNFFKRRVDPQLLVPTMDDRSIKFSKYTKDNK